MSGPAIARLTTERKNWRKDHPFGFVAKPETKPDGSSDFMKWKCLLPGTKGTDWENGLYPVTLTFTNDYPSQPPACHFPEGFFHPNVYPSGKVCLSIVNPDGSWKPSISIKQILEGIRVLLTEPNNDDPAQQEAYEIYQRQRGKYIERVRKQALKYRSDNV